MSRNILFVLLLNLLLPVALLAQQGDTKVAGQWTLQQVDINAENDVLTVENCVFRDLYQTNNALTLKSDGTGNFLSDEQNRTIEYEVVSGNIIKIFFKDGEKTSYNEYEYVVTGTSLELRREDPVVKEVYTFKRAQ